MKFVAPIRRTAVLRPIFTTQAQERALARLYLAVINVWDNPAILALYRKTLAELPPITRDTVPELEIAIERTADNAVRAIFDFRWLFQGWFTDLMAWHAEKFTSVLKYATGVDLRTVIGPVPADTVEAVIARNVALVRNVSDQTRQKISDAVFRALTARTPPRELAKEISGILGGQRARARRIASDQLSKMSSAMDTSRANDLGLTEWEWQHSEKVNFRPWHKARNGKIYDDRKLPAEIKTDQPGFAPFCGCKKKYRIGGDDEEIAPPKPARKPAANVEMKAFVLEKGRAEGVEYLAAHDRVTKKEVARYTDKERGSVKFTPEFIAAIERKDGEVIAHHNHPGSTAFSRPDLKAVNDFVGLRGLHAHGHDGTSYYVENSGNRPYNMDVYDYLAEEVRAALQNALNLKEISFDGASKSHAYGISVALHDLGLIDFRVTDASDANKAAWRETKPYIDRVITAAKKKYGQT